MSPPDATTWILLALLAGWAAADTTAALQVMAGQPLVAGWLAGLLLGEPLTGLGMGILLQLLWSRLAPVGAAAFPDVGPGTVSGVLSAVLVKGGGPIETPLLSLARGSGGTALLVGLFVALAAARFGQMLTILLRKDNARLAWAADRAAARGSFAGVEWENSIGVFRSFLRGIVIFTVSTAALFVLSHVARAIAGGSVRAADLSAPNPGVAAFLWFGILLSTSVLWRGGRRDWLVLLSGGAIGVLLTVIR
jgi:PTS system mannose-specific IIC component